MFKKTLLALAVTAFAGAASAAPGVTVTSAVVALEGNAITSVGNSKVQDTDGSSVVIEASTAYIVNDLIYLTVSGATFDVTDTPAIVVTTVGTGDANFIDFADANTARFRVSTADWATGDTLTVSGFTLKTAGATKDTVIKFASKAVSVNPLIGDYDKATAKTAFTFAPQLVQTITPLNGEVSTAKGRAEFTSSANQDVLTVAYTNAHTAVDNLDITKITQVVKGNFSYVMDYDLAANGGDADGVLDAAELATAFTTTLGAAANGADNVVYTLNTAMTELTATHNVVGDVTTTQGVDASIAIELNNVGYSAGGSVIKAPQTFTIDTTVSNGTVSYVLPQQSAGAFTLDGSTDDIELMPFGSEYAQSITVANTGSVEGAITVTLKANGSTYTKTLDAVATANTVTNISLEVAAFAAASGVTGNAHVNVVVNAPAGNIGVKGVYYHKASADRVLTH
ncbi:hypothetical protein [Pseudoalteromonas ulvae]|uniref:EF-hand domain-containing protein n=1 Tax=Pseudoalteromonas ulvae TaxID=107327 RepID=A0A244CQ63_PSEDV|nr:hypothetical protein [Pseudoalteromonas ulvae]OUL57636.1 hypothetical protein B1199_11260 [Pseudoalteromonas ulvae]